MCHPPTPTHVHASPALFVFITSIRCERTCVRLVPPLLRRASERPTSRQDTCYRMCICSSRYLEVKSSVISSHVASPRLRSPSHVYVSVVCGRWGSVGGGCRVVRLLIYSSKTSAQLYLFFFARRHTYIQLSASSLTSHLFFFFFFFRPLHSAFYPFPSPFGGSSCHRRAATPQKPIQARCSTPSWHVGQGRWSPFRFSATTSCPAPPSSLSSSLPPPPPISGYCLLALLLNISSTRLVCQQGGETP